VKPAHFACHKCGLYDSPTPCPCALAAWKGECSDCGNCVPFVEIAPGVWICPGCVEMHRRRMRGAA